MRTRFSSRSSLPHLPLRHSSCTPASDWLWRHDDLDRPAGWRSCRTPNRRRRWGGGRARPAGGPTASTPAAASLHTWLIGQMASMSASLDRQMFAGFPSELPQRGWWTGEFWPFLFTFFQCLYCQHRGIRSSGVLGEEFCFWPGEFQSIQEEGRERGRRVFLRFNCFHLLPYGESLLSTIWWHLSCQPRLRAPRIWFWLFCSCTAEI